MHIFEKVLSLPSGKFTDHDAYKFGCKMGQMKMCMEINDMKEAYRHAQEALEFYEQNHLSDEEYRHEKAKRW